MFCSEFNFFIVRDFRPLRTRVSFRITAVLRGRSSSWNPRDKLNYTRPRAHGYGECDDWSKRANAPQSTDSGSDFRLPRRSRDSISSRPTLSPPWKPRKPSHVKTQRTPRSLSAFVVSTGAACMGGPPVPHACPPYAHDGMTRVSVRNRQTVTRCAFSLTGRRPPEGL